MGISGYLDPVKNRRNPPKLINGCPTPEKNLENVEGKRKDKNH